MSPASTVLYNPKYKQLAASLPDRQSGKVVELQIDTMPSTHENRNALCERRKTKE